MTEVPKFKLREEDDITISRARKKRITQVRRKEHEQHGFGCSHCAEWVPIDEHIGTHNRNHCPHCLWSKHMDQDKLGDRKSDCESGMEPIALALKGEGQDKYGQREGRLGEIMLVHECVTDGQLRINRIAADDDTGVVLTVFEHGLHLPTSAVGHIALQGIVIVSQSMEPEIHAQLFGIA